MTYEIGAHLYSERAGGIYTHHGIYIGNNEVIHYSGFADGILEPGVIEVTTVDGFHNGHNVHVKTWPKRKYGGAESVERARSRLGEDWYNLLLNNCEHFVSWCITGDHSSEQVNNAILAIHKKGMSIEEGRKAPPNTPHGDPLPPMPWEPKEELKSGTIVMTGNSTTADTIGKVVAGGGIIAASVAAPIVAAPLAATAALGYLGKKLYDKLTE